MSESDLLRPDWFPKFIVIRKPEELVIAEN